MHSSDILGWGALIIVGTLVTILCYKNPYAARFMMVAFLLRAGAVLLHQYVMPLPDSGVDAVSFEKTAADWANSYGIAVVSEMPIGNSYLISWVIAVIYALTDRSLMMAQAISVALGTATVYLIYHLTLSLWQAPNIAKKAAWVATFFPTLILYSSLTMREAYVWFFLTIALIGVVQWVRTEKLKHLILIFGGFTGATLFHGAMLIGLLTFLGLIALRSLKKLLISLMRNRLHIFAIIFLVISIIPVGGFFAGAYSVSKIGSFENLMDAERLLRQTNSRTKSSGGAIDGAAYPAWTAPNTLIELPVKGIVRGIYFLFSPFPWDIRKANHLMGTFDALLYMIIVFLAWRNRKIIWADKAARTILLIFLAYIIVFGVAIGNFGTGLRHRTKFIGMLLVLAAPKIWRFNFKKIKKA